MDLKTTLYNVQVQLGSMIHVCGDLHGQYHDLLHILIAKGEPSEVNKYLVNGDIVDRGPQSLQCIVLLLAWHVADPASMFLNRGNHEAEAMNLKDGFHAELMEKYGDPVLFDFFQEVFSWLPAATLVDSKVFVTHGGLSSIPDLSLDDIRGLPRGRGIQPEDSPLLTDLLWSDPLTVLITVPLTGLIRSQLDEGRGTAQGVLVSSSVRWFSICRVPFVFIPTQ